MKAKINQLPTSERFQQHLFTWYCIKDHKLCRANGKYKGSPISKDTHGYKQKNIIILGKRYLVSKILNFLETHEPPEE